MTNRPSVPPPNAWSDTSVHLARLFDDPWYRNLLVILDALEETTRNFFRARAFRAVLLPVTTGAVSSPIASGSDSLPLIARIGCNTSYLADSQQFLLELTARILNTGVYYIMPSFRGDPVDTRHLSQFFHIEAEFPGCFDDVLELAGDYHRQLAAELLTRCSAEIVSMCGSITHIEDVVDHSPERIPFADVLKLLPDRATQIARRGALSADDEQTLLNIVGRPTWITHMPAFAVPFYQATQDGSTSLTADLLAGAGEILGAGERAHTADEVLSHMEAQAVRTDDYHWYIRMKRLSPLRTSGFGMGVERFLTWLLRHPDVRNCTLLLRDDSRANFQP